MLLQNRLFLRRVYGQVVAGCRYGEVPGRLYAPIAEVDLPAASATGRVDLILADIDLHGSRQAPHPGQRFNGLEQLPVRLLAALAVELPLPERYSRFQFARVLGIRITGCQPTERHPLG